MTQGVGAFQSHLFFLHLVYVKLQGLRAHCIYWNETRVFVGCQLSGSETVVKACKRYKTGEFRHEKCMESSTRLSGASRVLSKSKMTCTILQLLLLPIHHSLSRIICSFPGRGCCSIPSYLPSKTAYPFRAKTAFVL